jgi:ribose/xylose/arabinose/galactoside ABC-type transport system permease subunit
MLMAGAVLVCAVWTGWLIYEVPMVYRRGQEDWLLWDWLWLGLDYSWPPPWQVAALILVAAGGKLMLQDPPTRREGAVGWLIGFLVVLAVFLGMLRLPWQSPAAFMIPLMVGCGIGWMAGAGVLRYFLVPVLMTFVLIPPAFLLSLWMICRRWIFQIVDRFFFPVTGLHLDDVPASQVRWVEYLPSPVLTLMAAALFCWAVRGRRWLKVLVVLPALAHLVLDVCFNNEGC